jgi:streptogramin lyase/PKD repeat protein
MMSKSLFRVLVPLLAGLTLTGSAAADEPVLIGHFTEWDVAPANAGATWLDPDPDGTVWFTEQTTNGVAHLDPATNMLTEWVSPSVSTFTDGIAADGQGRAYFTTPPQVAGQPNTVMRVDPLTNDFTRWTLPNGSAPGAFLLDYSGKVYFTEYYANRIARLDPDTNTLTEWAIPSANGFPEDIVVAPNGRVYFTEDGKHKIGELNPATGTFREWLVPATGADLDRMMIRVDAFTGDVWLSLVNTNQIQRLSPATGTFTRWAAPTVGCPASGFDCYAYGIDVDAAGRAWFAHYVGNLWMLDPALDPGVSSVVAPVSTVKAAVNTVLPPAVIHVDPTVSAVVPRESSSLPIIDGAFTGWQVGIVESGPFSLRLDAAGNAWFGNLGEPHGIGHLTVEPDFAPTALIAPVLQGFVGAPIALDGTGSFDPDGDALTYAWTLTTPGGSASTLSSADSATPSFTPDLAGVYQVTLTVTDTHGVASAPVSIAIQVAAPICLTIARGVSGAVKDAQITRKTGVSPALDVLGNTNYGASATAAAGRFAVNIVTKVLLHFDVSAVPPGALVVSSSLTVQASTAGAGNVKLLRALAPWNEATVTYINFGLGQDTVVQATTFDGGAGYVGPLSFDIKPLSQAWIDGTLANHGLVINGEPGVLSTFATSESADIASRPRLDLCYFPPQ